SWSYLAVFYERRLRLPSNYYVVSLAVADLAIGIAVVPISAVYEIATRWLLGQALCRMWISADITCCTASIINLCAISFDRYRALSQPMLYPQYSTAKRSCITITGIWAASLAISTPTLFGVGIEKRQSNQCLLAKRSPFVVFSACGSFFIPLCIMLVLYRLIFKIANKQRRKIQRGQSVGFSHLNNDIEFKSGLISKFTLFESATKRNGDSIAIASSSHAAALAQQRRQSGRRPKLLAKNPVAQRLRRLGSHTKAAKTLGIVVGAFVFCWGPFFFTYLLHGVCYSCRVPDTLVKYFVWLGYCNSFLNPIIYPCLNKDFRRAFRKLLTRHYCKRKSLDYWNSRRQSVTQLIKASRHLRVSIQ
uniref:G_PROTEIN_RECEP_F1_2 domain-containing protein n=1 Tax=Macrostomum lignano TaxID=282301 RepID=A0A1I8HKX2_9PLAT